MLNLLLNNKEKTENPSKETEDTVTTEDSPETNTLAIDPTITQDETKKAENAEATAMEAKLAAEKVVEKATNEKKAETQVNAADLRKGEVKESEELVDAVKADAKKRGKTFDTCLVTGVLVVK